MSGDVERAIAHVEEWPQHCERCTILAVEVTRLREALDRAQVILDSAEIAYLSEQEAGAFVGPELSLIAELSQALAAEEPEK